MTTSTLPVAPRSTDGAAPGAPAEPDRAEPQDPGRTPPRAGRLLRGRGVPQTGRTVAVLVLLVGTAVLYLWSLSASGYGNSFYSAAVQAGSQSWKAFFYGSLDAGNAITVDKPPASLWLMALSVRLFGLSSWSILAPQALLGVATVGVVYASVRRTSGHVAGLLAGAVLALTPAAALMFRFNNPDALLVFLLTCATYVTLRATEKASGKVLAWAGVLIGFAFLTKMLQAFLVLPAFVLVYLIAAPTTVGKRFLHLLGAFAAMIVSLGWWVAVVELVPASWRPYVGGSEDNSILNLIIGYNGLGRILGQGSGNGGGGGTGFGGATGITRLFVQVSGGMVTWLLPAALLLAAAALVALRHLPRTDPRRAAILVWTGWTVATGLTFSFMAGTYHDYYVVALAPAIAAGVAVAGQVLWSSRTSWLSRGALAVTTAVTAGWAFVLLGRATGIYTELRVPVLVVGVLAAIGLLLVHRLPRIAAAAVLALAVAGAATGPTAYALNTVATPHTGSIPTAGPVSGGGFGGGAGGQGRGTRRDGQNGPGGFPGGGVAPGQTGQAPGATAPGQTGQAPGGTAPGQQPGGTTRPGTTQRGGGGGMGDEAASTELVQLLQADTRSFRWEAATTGSQSSASYQLASQRPVMAIGGFNGGDPSPTLAQFQAYVSAGDIHYYIVGGRGGGPGGNRGTASQISTWVTAHYTAKTVGGTTVYDLTAPTS